MLNRKQLSGRTLVLVLALATMLATFGGCRPGGGPGGPGGTGTSGGGQPAVIAWSEPWGPVNLKPETARQVLALPGSLTSLPTAPDTRGEWAFHVRHDGGAAGDEMVLFGDVLVTDGRAWRGQAVRTVWLAVAAEVCGPAALVELLTSADGVRVLADDVPTICVTLDASSRLQVVEAARDLTAWEGTPTEPPPALYPHYRLEVRRGKYTVQLWWHHDHIVAGWQTDTGGYGQADFRDPELALWRLVYILAPAPDPGQAGGITRLYLYDSATAEGGPLAQGVLAGASQTAAVVGCLTKGEPAPEGVRPPADEAPVTVTFSDGAGRLPSCAVMLYRDGFVLDGRFYLLPGAQRTVLTTMSAG